MQSRDDGDNDSSSNEDIDLPTKTGDRGIQVFEDVGSDAPAWEAVFALLRAFTA
jgi:hypothetical protein